MAKKRDGNTNQKIRKLRREFEALPKRRRYSLGGRGVEILNKIHRLEIQKEKRKINMAKKRKIGSAWGRRDRLINGKPRRVWVRKKDGKYQTKKHKPEVHGIALASKLMAQRPKKSQKRDKQRSHKKKIRPTDKNLKSWKKRPGSADIRGNVDSKK